MWRCADDENFLIVSNANLTFALLAGTTLGAANTSIMYLNGQSSPIGISAIGQHMTGAHYNVTVLRHRLLDYSSASTCHFPCSIALAEVHLTDCCTCRPDDYDICLGCVLKGNTCRNHCHQLHPIVSWSHFSIVAAESGLDRVS